MLSSGIPKETIMKWTKDPQVPSLLTLTLTLTLTRRYPNSNPNPQVP